MKYASLVIRYPIALASWPEVDRPTKQITNFGRFHMAKRNLPPSSRNKAKRQHEAFNDVAKRLRELRTEIRQTADPDLARDEYGPRLTFRSVDDLFDLKFHGDPYEEAFHLFLRTICERRIVKAVRSLSLTGPDEGANGTRNFDFTEILSQKVRLSHLKSIHIEQGFHPQSHNTSIVARIYEEDGQLAGLLRMAPKLESLTSPSAPNSEFFAAGRRPIQTLDIDTGYDHQGFIRNLAQSNCFPQLRRLFFGDATDSAVEGTPVEDFICLAASRGMESISRIIVRNPRFSHGDIQELKRLLGKKLRVVYTSPEFEP